MEKAWSRYRGGGADNKKITFIFQNEPFLLLTGYLEFHFRSQGKSGKSQGIPSWKKSGNPVMSNRINQFSSAKGERAVRGSLNEMHLYVFWII